MKKTFTLSLALALTVSVYADGLQIFNCGKGIPGVDEPQLMGLGISPDGHYICGPTENGSGLFIADRFTGDVKWAIAEGDEGGELRHVDNNGIAVGFNYAGTKFDFATGTQTPVVAPEGYRYILCEDITADGSMIVGSMAGESFTTEAAYSKDGGEWVLLPQPTADDLGIYFDKILAGSAAKYVSNDGKIILGYVGSFTIPMAWIMNDKGEYEIDFFPMRYIKESEEDSDEAHILYSLSAMYLNMSDNGKYISLLGMVRDETIEDYLNVPVIYNTETRDITVYKGVQKIDETLSGLYPTAICDDGTFIGTIGQPFFGEFGCFIMKAGETEAQTYNEAFPAFKEKLGTSEEYGFNMPTGMSADGKYLLGYTYYCEDYNDEDADAYYLTYVIERDPDSSIESISVDTAPAVTESIYGIDGQRRATLTKGLNIIRMSDGTARKVMVK